LGIVTSTVSPPGAGTEATPSAEACSTAPRSAAGVPESGAPASGVPAAACGGVSAGASAALPALRRLVELEALGELSRTANARIYVNFNGHEQMGDEKE